MIYLDFAKKEVVKSHKEAEGDERHAKKVSDEDVVARVVDVLPDGVGADPGHLNQLCHIVTSGILDGKVRVTKRKRKMKRKWERKRKRKLKSKSKRKSRGKPPGL